METRQDFWELAKLVYYRLRNFVRDDVGHHLSLPAIRRWVNNHVYRTEIFFQKFGKSINHTIDTLTLLSAAWCIGNIIFQLGFQFEADTGERLVESNSVCIVGFGVVQILKLLNYWKSGSRMPITEIAYALLTWIYVVLSRSADFEYQSLLSHRYTINAVAALISVNEISRLGILILGRRTSPTMLFVGSFIFIIGVGTGLLMMPRCHEGELTVLQALFTSTSAVCVTGMSVVDMNSVFTPFGYVILLILIQLGGIGVMTFTCFFALSLSGKSSLSNRMVIRDLISAENMGDIFTTLKRIFYVTLMIEVVSAWLIYFELTRHNPEAERAELIFTSIFHAVSAFCNAGISNLEGGLHNPLTEGNRLLMMIIAATAFIGGVGFPLQSSIIDWVKHRFHRFAWRLFNRGSDRQFRARLINANSRIFFYAHTVLFVLGAGIYLVSEMHHSMRDFSWCDRLLHSSFMSVVSRSAGFDVGDINLFSPVTLMFIAILMWIGCSPLSTGGGVKVTTAAMMLLNLRCALKRKDDIEIFGRRIAPQSIQRAFATVVLSVAAVIVSAIVLKAVNPDISFTRLLFESNAALSTAGISYGLAQQMDDFSQSVLIADMFIGRIGILAFALCFFSPSEKQYYKYPTENIMI